MIAKHARLILLFALLVPAPLWAGQFSWRQPHATVLPTGNLKWAPKPFIFTQGDVVRYIDFESGDDANAGNRQHPWKHHPWDAAATGEAKAATRVDTYVFKRGVIYRGMMRAAESGRPGRPIRLTSDPSWGTGEAMIYGSVRLQGPWKRCTPADAPGIPQPQTVWRLDLGADFDTDSKDTRLSALWRLADGRAVRLHIARDPNWTITDPDFPMANWARWTTFTEVRSINDGWLADPDRLTGKPKDFFRGVQIWTQHRHLMGSPHKLKPRDYDPTAGAFLIDSPGGARFRRGPRRNRPFDLRGTVGYYLENVRGYLDSPGEYYFDVDGPHAGRLYLRLNDDSNPNFAVLEAAMIRSPIQIFDRSHIEVSGLSFSFNDDDDGLYGYPPYISASPMVRIVGNCRGIAVRNCRFTDVMNAVVAFPRPTAVGGPAEASRPDIGEFDDDVMDDIAITDNDVLNCDMAGAIWVNGASQRFLGERFGRLGHLVVLRNRVVNSGYRPGKSPVSSIPAISVITPETAEIAGNIVDTSWGNGIFTLGGKVNRSLNNVPLARMLIHHNQLDNTMLGCNDYGGLEIFQGGPAYIYNNVSRNSVGTQTFVPVNLAYNLYLDGAFKVCSFNNILAGKVTPDRPDRYGHCGYFMVFGFLDHLFNNTIYHFEYGLNGSSGNRSCILGNVIVDCSKSFMGQNRPGDVSMLGGGDTGEMGRKGVPTMSYGSNVFWGSPKGGRRNEGDFGFVGGIGPTAGGGAKVYSGDTIEELREALAAMNARVSSIGVHVNRAPLLDPARFDYRLLPESDAKGKGVKFFVPWALARVVGEWNFYAHAANPLVVLGENFYMQPEHMERGMYYFIPRNDLTVSYCKATDYVQGPLEDWIAGALRFDGVGRYAVLTHADMTRDGRYPVKVGNNGRVVNADPPALYPGAKRETLDMGANNFLIEVCFRCREDRGDGVIAGKYDGASGYELAIDPNGALMLTVAAGGKTGAVAGPKINDGAWRHVIAEVNRETSEATIYVDGKQAARSSVELESGASLTTRADFWVGKGHDGRFFAGDIDFLRISRGTLADAKTTIEELYAWEYDGPHLRDFTGRKPVGKRDAGALQAAR